jgi:Cation/multidrug efflux pump
MLFLTGTPLSVPALMGAIMCMGVATANSILVISFAREQLDRHGDPGPRLRSKPASHVSVLY